MLRSEISSGKKGTRILGYTLALACPIFWSIAIIMFKKAGHSTDPVVLNLIKNTLSFFLFIPTAFLFEGSITIPDSKAFWMLFASGFVGIGLSDYFVLKALSYMGASRVGILETLYSPFVILLSLLFLGEVFNVPKLVGAVLVMGAIMVVSRDGLTETKATGKPERILAGSLWGATGLFGMAAGIVLVKPLFATVPLFSVIVLRLGAGVVSSLLVFFTLKDKKALIASFTTADRKPMMIMACLLSTYVAMGFWVAGFKYNDAIITAVLNQTSTIFTVLFAAYFLKEGLSPSKIAGTLLATTGVIVIALA